MLTFDSRENSDASAKFESWRTQNANGFVINFRSVNEMMLHRASCGHFDFNVKVNLAASPKYCSLNRDELQRWARERNVDTLKLCRSCDPLSDFD
ncbi:MAG: hypothetical protein HY259_09430 [Chloroflexi bacterium]|nr:hypothetical protein [Chloroflexota bacterium]